VIVVKRNFATILWREHVISWPSALLVEETEVSEEIYVI